MTLNRELQTKASLAFNMRTIKYVKILGLNSWKFVMTDGGTVTIDTEHFGYNIYGPVIIEQGLEDNAAT